jgi:uncharacterized damage-inducible protein DinB
VEDAAVTVQESVLPDIDHEMAATRRLLERVPAADLAWAPHERSYSLGELSMHLARLVSWGRSILDRDFYDLAGVTDDRPDGTPVLADVLATFDRETAALRQSLVGKSDGELLSPWELRRGTEVLMSMPRVTALRRFVLHHLVHHRGQLSVYLRLRNVPLPPIYGPTADERM